MVKLSSLFLMLNLCSLISRAQNDSIHGNSCQTLLNQKKLSVQYSYNSSTQTHDYSGNWDFDQDGKTDGVFFKGTGGAHLYFQLSIVLTTEKTVKSFPFIELDFPCLGSIIELESARFYPPPSFPSFVVSDFDEDAVDEIYICLDRASSVPGELIKQGVNSRYLLLDYKNGEMMVRNFVK